MDLCEVREPGAVPVDVHDVAVEPDQVQRHLGVVGAGERVGDRAGGVAGCAGSAIHATAIGALSTRVAATVDPSGLHQKPRCLRISSAAMKSALPHVTVSGSSSPPAITRHDPSSSATQRVRSLT